jgi:hypothetical protein
MDRRAFLTQLPETWPIRALMGLALAAAVYLALLGLWHGRDLVMLLAWLGLKVVVAVLPIPASVRARFGRVDPNDRYWSYRYRSLLWIGLGTLAGQLWLAHPGPYRAMDFLVAGLLAAVGLVASLVWHARQRSLPGNDGIKRR